MQRAADPPGFGVTVAALALGQVLSWAVLFYAFTAFVLPMQAELGWDKPTLMGAFTLGLAVNGATTYAVGVAIDRGHARAAMAGGALLAGLGCIAWSRIDAPWQLYACWAVLGAAMSATLYEPAFMVVTKRFPARFKDGITRLTLVGGFASTLCYPALAWLIGRFGWRGALLAMGLVMALLVAPLHAWVLRGAASVPPSAAGDGAGDTTLRDALRHRAFWLLTASFALYAFVTAAFWAHVVPAFAAKGLGEAAATAVLVWFGPAQVAGRFVHALLGRNVPLRALGVVVLLAIPAALVLFALGRTVPVLIAFALLFGVANGLVTIVRGALVPETFGRAHIGRISGAMAAVAMVARAAAPWSAALVLLAIGGYRELMLLLAAVGVVAVLAFGLAGSSRAAAARLDGSGRIG
ncbi:MAG: MFS transporter [Ideonella sp.]|nr:MFS transporter [Ideonella sp.]MCC7457331.1 MFS transporter [Nitrospira sp.]